MGAKILLVDDEPEMRDLIRMTLTCGKSYQFLEAWGGKQALELAIKEHPDLVLLDIVMPQMDGFEVCRQLRAMPEMIDVPVVMLTALVPSCIMDYTYV